MARAKCYNTLDAYCRLIALLVRHSGDASNNVTKINLLSRVSGNHCVTILLNYCDLIERVYRDRTLVVTDLLILPWPHHIYNAERVFRDRTLVVTESAQLA